MDDSIRIDRREFTREAVLAMLAGVTVTVTGCGGGGGGNPAGPSGGSTGAASDRVGLIVGNHGHTAVITSAQLVAGNAVELDIRGTADHPHRLTLTADEVRTIAAGREVSKTSSDTLEHTHLVTFRPGTPTPPDPGY